jgi:DNA (cytosine-5)-methyltransferase 1
MRYASICSGIEAVSVAFQPLGWQPVFFSEIESFPCAVLQHYHPNVPNYGDMTKFKDWKYEPIDLLVGGTPCQSFSIAGLRKGLDDPRGNLALVFLAIVDKYRPKWVVWENVPGVHSSWSDASHVIASSASEKAGREARRLAREAGFDGYAAESFGEFEEVVQSNDFDCFLAGLEQLGYGVATTILDCQFFGLAQRRERVFVVGHLGDWRRPAAVLFDASCVSWNFAPSRHAPSRQAGKRISPTIGGGPPFSRTGNDRVESEALVADTLRANGGQGSRKDKQPMVYAFQSRIARNGRGDMGDKVNALNAQSGETGKGDAAPLVAIGVDLFNQAETGDVHCPLRTAGGHGDGAHMGGLNGQDAYSGRIIPHAQCGWNGQKRLGDGNVCSDQSGRFL